MQEVAAECRRRGWAHLAVAEALGVGRNTVRGWYQSGLGLPAKVRRDEPIAVVPVQIDLQPSTVTVVSPDGWRIEGVDLGGAVALMAQLR